jgi:RNA polymerase sigma-70 factor (ECF subfamily)
MLAIAAHDWSDDMVDSQTFGRCYARHRGEVYHLCLRYGGGRLGWAEDVTHDVFVKLLEYLPRLEETEDVGGWLYRVATNLCISRLRREQSKLAWVRRVFREEPEEAASTEVLFEQREVAARAMATLNRLPARERVVLSMKVLDGKSQREIAETLSMSEGYVSKILARAWGRIRAEGWEVTDERA